MRHALFLSLALAACAPPGDAREATLVQVLVKADEVVLRTRPQLVRGKFARMAASPFDFYRGSVPLFRADGHGVGMLVGWLVGWLFGVAGRVVLNSL